MSANQLFEEMRKDPSNKQCFECSKANPQWASVPFAIILCLDCAGIHRSLGVHISFVRSLPLDSWTEQQLACMRAGGNRPCQMFLKKYGVDTITDFTEKYSTSAARAYRAKIEALSEGRPWQDPSPNELSRKYPPLVSTPKNVNISRGGAPPGVGSSADSNQGFRNSGGYSSVNRDGSFGNGGRDGGNGGRDGGNGSNSGGYGGRDSGRENGLDSPYNGRAGPGGLGTGRQMGSVSSRSSSSMQSPAHPRGGGGGFDDDPWSMLATGWDTLASIASTATQTVVEVAGNVDVEDVKTNLADYGQKGWDWTMSALEMAKQAINTDDWYEADPNPRQGGYNNNNYNNSYGGRGGNDFDDYNRSPNYNDNQQRNRNNYNDYDRRTAASDPYARKRETQQQSGMSRSGQLPRQSKQNGDDGWNDWDGGDSDWLSDTPPNRNTNDSATLQENRTPQRNPSSNLNNSGNVGNKNTKSEGWDDEWTSW